MKIATVTGSLLFALAATASAEPPAKRAARAYATATRTEAHAAPLPMLPSVARVRVEAAHDRVLVIEEVNLPRGEWRVGGLDFYVAFGAPGVPLAIDAHLVPVPYDSPEPRLDSAGEPLTIEQADRRTSSVTLLLGRPQMAGVVVRIRESDLRRAYAVSSLAALRIRSLLSPPAADPSGARDVVVRLGIVGELPLALGHLQVVSLEGRRWITRVQASLCGPEAVNWPLAVSLIPKESRALEAQGEQDAASVMAPVAPLMAVRHDSDDLCIRWWAPP